MHALKLIALIPAFFLFTFCNGQELSAIQSQSKFGLTLPEFDELNKIIDQYPPMKSIIKKKLEIKSESTKPGDLVKIDYLAILRESCTEMKNDELNKQIKNWYKTSSWARHKNDKASNNLSPEVLQSSPLKAPK